MSQDIVRHMVYISQSGRDSMNLVTRGANGYRFYCMIKGPNNIDYIDPLPTNHAMPNGSLYSRLLWTTLEKY